MANVILGAWPNALHCLCSGIGTPPPDCGYAWRAQMPVRKRERYVKDCDKS